MSDLLLLSGGIDSTALAYMMRPALCMTVNYGQNAAAAEIKAAQRICSILGLSHQIIEANLRALGTGDMSGRDASTTSKNSEFWAFRNQFLITLGAMSAVAKGLDRVVIGSVKTDVKHKDGTNQFRAKLDQLLQLQEGQIELIAPASEMSSEELVVKSGISIDLLSWAHSCHKGVYACGACNGCHKHSEVMTRFGIKR